VAPLWLPGATGDPGGRPALRRDLLSGRQMHAGGPNASPRPDGPLPPSRRLRSQAAVRLPALPWRAAAAPGGPAALLLWSRSRGRLGFDKVRGGGK